jgi:hypothetical protein
LTGQSALRNGDGSGAREPKRDTATKQRMTHGPWLSSDQRIISG